MKLSFSTNAFVRYSVFNAIEKIAAIGYEGVELLADVPHLYVYSITDSDMRRLKEVIARAGIKVANISANTAMGYYGRMLWETLYEPSISNPNPTVRKWRIDYSKKCIDLAHALGAPGISLTSGRAIPGTSPEQSMELLKESLRELAGYAAERRVYIAVEGVPGLLIEHAGEIDALLNEINAPFLGANFDFGHSRVLGEDMEEAVKRLAGRIMHVYLSDIRARKDYDLIPGLGSMDFEAVFSLLEKYGYNGFVTVDLHTYSSQAEEAARKSFRYLREMPLLTANP